MNTIKATVRNGRIEQEAPADWPEGSTVLIEPVPTGEGRIGMEEAEWREDPAALADWEQWLATIEPLEFTPEEEAAQARFRDDMLRYNLEAVRRQMAEEPLP